MIFKRENPVTSALIVLNLIVYAMWVGLTPKTWGINEAFMSRHFLVSWAALTEGRWWVLLSSVFSQVMFLHLFVNMFVLNSFGRFLERFLGGRFYLCFYLFAGLVSSLSHAALSRYLLNSPGLPALGASGAIAGLVLLFGLIFPKEKIVLFAVIPVPALLGVAAFVALDVWGLYAQANGGGFPIGHGAHLGGSLAGALTYFVILRPRLDRSRMLSKH